MNLVSTRRLLARATGRNAISWWTWIITFPFAMTVMSGLQYVDHGRSLGPAAAVAAVEHLAIGVVLLAAYGVLRVTPDRVRSVVVLLLFAAVGVVRPFLFLGSASLLGIPAEPGDLGMRAAINIVISLAVFSLIAIGVDLVRDHRGVYRRLNAARQAAEADARSALGRIRNLRATSVDAVLAAIEDAAAPAMLAGIEPADASRLLRTLAKDIVRPASHELYAGGDAPETEVDEPSLSGRAGWLRSVFGGMRAAPPLPTAALFVGMVAPFAVDTYGFGVALVQAPVAFVILLLGNLAVARVSSRIARPAARVVTVLAGYVAVGVVLTIESELLLRGAGFSPQMVVFQAFVYPFVAAAVAFVSSLSVRVRADQSELEKSMQEAVEAAARVRAEYDHERASIARLLHSGVQSELIASALWVGMRGASPAEASAAVRDAVERIRNELRGARPKTDARTRIRMLADSWRSAMALEVRIDDAVWDRLADDRRCEAVVDAMSEGLANAVRHGDGSPVTLEVDGSPSGGVLVIVTSGGDLVSPGAGIGLADLADRAEVALRERSGGVELAVAIP
jgi:signal transduction histidine kinase